MFSTRRKKEKWKFWRSFWSTPPHSIQARYIDGSRRLTRNAGGWLKSSDSHYTRSLRAFCIIWRGNAPWSRLWILGCSDGSACKTRISSRSLPGSGLDRSNRARGPVSDPGREIIHTPTDRCRRGLFREAPSPRRFEEDSQNQHGTRTHTPRETVRGGRRRDRERFPTTGSDQAGPTHPVTGSVCETARTGEGSPDSHRFASILRDAGHRWFFRRRFSRGTPRRKPNRSGTWSSWPIPSQCPTGPVFSPSWYSS